MSFTRWLRNLQPFCHPGTTSRKSRRATRREPSNPLRLHLEVLEDRRTPSFSPATSFPVGPNPQAVVSADFNGDGRLDLATVNSDSDTVSVLLGDGAGGFGAAIGFDAGSFGGNRASLAVADFNNDGRLDLATAIYFYDAPNYNNEFGRLGVLLGNGDGTFQAATHPLGSGVPLSVAVGDFNNDGTSDLAVSEDGGNSFGDVAVLRGDGRGGFSVATTYPISSPNHGLAVGDLNGDGNLDAVTVSGAGGVGGNALLGNGDGEFGSAVEFATNWNPQAVAVGDFTGDGIPDLVVAGEAVDILVGRGDGTFDSPIANSANGSEHTGVAVADFNGDGRLDAVTSDADTGTVSELLSNGDGTLVYAGAYAVGSSPTTVAVGDFNGDGRIDAAAANAGSNTLSVLLNDGTQPPPPPTVHIGDATVTEGNTGTAAATFTVTLSAAGTQTITVAYETGNGTATTGSDFNPTSGILTFAPGETEKTITVPVIGDRFAEPNETFVVNLSSPTNATISNGQGVGTILDDEPRVSTSDASKKEGNSGLTAFTFTVNLSVPYDVPVTIGYSTADSTATAGSDYQAAAGTLTIPAGQTSGTITVQAIGDRLPEPNETFLVNLSNSNYGVISDGQGVGTILDDEPRISISDVTKQEGKKNQTTLFTFTVTLSAAYDQAVTMSFRTVDGTATTSDGDYAGKTGTLTFAPGETTKTITIEVKGDSKKEADEYFYLDLFGNSGNSLFTKNRGTGTILNDD